MPRLRDTLDTTTRVLDQSLVIQACHQTRDLTLVSNPHEIGDLTVTRTELPPTQPANRPKDRIGTNRQTQVSAGPGRSPRPSAGPGALSRPYAGPGRSPGRPAKAGLIGREETMPLSREGARTRFAGRALQLPCCCRATAVREH